MDVPVPFGGGAFEPVEEDAEEITIQLPCLPCVVAGGGDPPAPGSSSSSSPFLRIREGD